MKILKIMIVGIPLICPTLTKSFHIEQQENMHCWGCEMYTDNSVLYAQETCTGAAWLAHPSSCEDERPVLKTRKMNRETPYESGPCYTNDIFAVCPSEAIKNYYLICKVNPHLVCLYYTDGYRLKAWYPLPEIEVEIDDIKKEL